jgi:hypothetical protein
VGGARLRVMDLGEDVLSVLLSWLLRGLMAIGGTVLVYQGLPVAKAALQAQKADAVVMKLRRGQEMSVPEVSAGIAALNSAVTADPVGDRYLQRSELEGGAALTAPLKISLAFRTVWLNSTRSDLELGLAAAPARSIDWLRLAATRQGLDGPSREVIPPLLMSIQTGPWIEPVWPVRLRLIVDNWGYFTDVQKEEMQAYVVELWKHASDQRFFAFNINNPVDELIIRNLLRDQSGAQESLTKWILVYKK